MRRAAHGWGAAGLASIGLLAAAATLRCSGDVDNHATGGASGSGGGATDATVEAEADAAPDSGETDWEPLEPLGENGEYFPEGPAAPQLDCHPWCKAVIPIEIDHPGYYTYSFDSSRIADGDLRSLYLTDLSTGTARLVAKSMNAKEGVIQPHVHGRYLSYHRSEYPRGQIEVIDLIEKRRRVVHTYVASDSGSGTVAYTAVNATHAFFITTGALWSADLQTGAKRKITPYIIGCDRHCTTDALFICSTTTQIVTADPVTGALEVLGPSKALQTDGVCSADKRFFTWVDFRDPPGPASTYDGTRTGGEVYLYDLLTKDLKRVTHDSPDHPKAKTFPAVEGKTVVWRQMASTLDQNPEWAQDIYMADGALWRHDLDTGKTCYSDTLNIGSPALIGGKFYAKRVNDPNGTGGSWIIEVDLDHPAIPWTCTQ